MTTGDLASMVGVLARLEARVEDAERIDRIRLLEELKSAAAAAQAVETTAFVASQKGAQVDAGVRAKDVGKGVAAQVALAKRESPARGRRYAGWAAVLTTELPGTFAELAAGRISEWRAQVVARETGWLSAEHRAVVDAELAPRLEQLGDRQVEAEAKKLAYRLDPHGFVARQARAEQDRRVSLRPAPDTMSILSGLLPVAQGVAVFAALGRRADSLRAEGDGRSRGQIMADTLVERVTGQATASAVGVEVKLVMTDQTLFNHGEGSTPTPRPVSWSRWTPGGARSPAGWASCSSPATRSAGRRGAMRRCGTVTTWSRSRTAGGGGRGAGRDHHPDRARLPQPGTRPTGHHPPRLPRVRRAPAALERARRLARAKSLGGWTMASRHGAGCTSTRP